MPTILCRLMSEAADHIYKRAKDRVYKLLPYPLPANSIVATTTATSTTTTTTNNNNNNMKATTANKKQSKKQSNSDATAVGIGLNGGVETTAGDYDGVMIYVSIV